MIHDKTSRVMKVCMLVVAFTLVSTALVFAQAGWKSVKEQGFTFKYPADWNYLDLGGDDYDGSMGYTKALSPPAEENFAMVIMIFPKFILDLKAAKISYQDFMKMVFENFLAQGDQKGFKIEPTTADLSHGQVAAFMVVDEASTTGFKASQICGDLRSGSAAILMLSMDLPKKDLEKGKTYINQAEEIMATFAFPK